MYKLNSLSYMADNIDYDFYALAWTEIEKLKSYFVKFCGNKSQEAMNSVFYHVITHYDKKKSKRGVKPYIKKLAREIEKKKFKDIPVNFIEALSDNDLKTLETQQDKGLVGNVRKNLQITPDIADDVIEDIFLDIPKDEEVAKFILSNMKMYITLCEALITKSLKTSCYTKEFINEVNYMASITKNFPRLCLDYYNVIGDSLEEFLNLDLMEKDWVEADYGILRKKNKRLVFINSDTHRPVEDIDLDDCVLNGLIGNQYVYRIDYFDLAKTLCDLIDDEETNIMKYVLDENYVIKTLGGSLSIVNAKIENEYQLVIDEIVTNILRRLVDTSLIDYGSHSCYVLSKDELNKEDLYIHAEVKGIDINLEVQLVEKGF